MKVSTNALPVRCSSTVSEKLQPKYIGPFTVLSVDGKVLHLQLPKAYSQVHDKFNVEQVRPWLHSGDCTVDPDLPDLQPHPSLNPVVQILDRAKFGRAPKRIGSLLEIPAQYVVVYRDGSTGWVRGSHLRTCEEKKLVKAFEFRSSERRGCPAIKSRTIQSLWLMKTPCLMMSSISLTIRIYKNTTERINGDLLGKGHSD